MLLLVFGNRNRVKKQPGIFPVKIRLEPDLDSESNKESKWPRMAGYAHWIHDVLIVSNGLGLMQTIPYGINTMEGPVQDAEPEEIKGLGDHPKVIRARLDDGLILQVAVGELHPRLAPEHLQTGEAQ